MMVHELVFSLVIPLLYRFSSYAQPIKRFPLFLYYSIETIVGVFKDYLEFFIIKRGMLQ
jgi:hypothetical protein